MAIVFAETPDATQGTEFYNAVTGTVTYDAVTATKSGLASWKCDGGSGATAHLDMAIDATARRMSAYMRFAALPASTVQIFSPGVTGFRVALSSGGVLSLIDILDSEIVTGSTLSINTWYRLSLSWNGSGSGVDAEFYLDGVSDMSATNEGIAFAVPVVGWGESPGSGNKLVNVAHFYTDDTADLSDTGDIRVTAKLPSAHGSPNDFNVATGNNPTNRWENVNERPLSETNGWEETGSARANEIYDIELAAEGDVDISATSLIGYIWWIWAKRDSGGGGTPQILWSNNITGITLTSGTFELFTVIEDTTSHLISHNDDIGMRATDSSADAHLAECGQISVYIAAAAPVASTSYAFWF